MTSGVVRLTRACTRPLAALAAGDASVGPVTRTPFLSFHTFTNYVKVTFFQGVSLRPVPPGGKARDARWIDIHKDDLDAAQLAMWMRQAAALPGWGIHNKRGE